MYIDIKYMITIHLIIKYLLIIDLGQLNEIIRAFLIKESNHLY